MKKLKFFLFILFVLLNVVKAQTLSYFPNKANDNDALDSFTIKWYSGQLAAMKEPVLYNRKADNETYRFT
ncbi:hypothetical protein JN11_00126 [Mucilaginibacter frigoritolerans]|uniref:Uncharacterized protein n=1 Tax=Mucilaginibacter frigoritolerans TaxID=652788 RepID=A0A562UF51_9SPHI|nr:hypothetical protein [Mucilaginibacter frigoritolerans]TWJ04418.1 hypothetical protein JN11_00126 [Mucilaginibacter frigoritolerans]